MHPTIPISVPKKMKKKKKKEEEEVMASRQARSNYNMILCAGIYFNCNLPNKEIYVFSALF
jgi:hypothetical protein